VDYFANADRDRIDRDWVWGMLSQEAYWGRWRSRAEVEAQLDGAWRVVGVYEPAEQRQVAYARAVSDGIGDAYLADVIVDPRDRGNGIGKLLIRTMIDEGPGSELRWTLFTADAHGLYAQFGFAAPDATAMVRPSRRAPK
jgi:GNAT superfamily N-acetyltransferase